MPHANLYNAMGQLKLKNIFALTPGGTMGMPNDEVNAGKFDKPGLMGGMMTMEEMMGMKMTPGMKMEGMQMGDMPMNDGMKMDHNMPMDGGMEMKSIWREWRWTPTRTPTTAKAHRDFIPLGPDIGSRAIDDGRNGRTSRPALQGLAPVRNTGLSSNARCAKCGSRWTAIWNAMSGR